MPSLTCKARITAEKNKHILHASTGKKDIVSFSTLGRFVPSIPRATKSRITLIDARTLVDGLPDLLAGPRCIERKLMGHVSCTSRVWRP